MATEDDIQGRLAELEAREREVAARERVMEAKSVHRNMYAHINLSPRVIDAIIIVCGLVIIGLVVFGSSLGRTP